MSEEKEINIDELIKNADEDSIFGLIRSIKEKADNINDLLK
jgi:hypothetical protein